MAETEERSTAIVPASPADIAKAAGDIPEDALVGETLHDTYSVVRFLAEGGMGRVYEAQHTRIATKRFAIKVLHAELKHSIDVRMRFRREAEAAACIEHPNVVGVHDFGYTNDGRPYLVSDLLEGRELNSLLDDGKPIPIPLAARIASQLCRALEAAHDKGVIHRDLKPANVFLVGPPDALEVKVLDFGLSKILELADATDTQSGTVMGTPSYMAPEQAKGQRADHRADIYGVGAVLYACITGKPPFEEDSPHQTVLAVMTREPVRPCILQPSIPPELEVVVQRAMAHEPADRYASMRELGAALAPFSDEGPSTRGSSAKGPPSNAPRPLDAASPGHSAYGVRRRAMGWLILAALMMLVGGLSSVIGAFPLVTGARALLPTELLLVSLALFGSLFTPGLLFVLWLRRRYWNNSAKMLGLVGAVRAPVVAAAAVVGIAALTGRMLDAGSMYFRGLGRPPNASGWPGWAPFLFGLGLVAAIATIARGRILGTSRSLLRRIVAGPFLLGLAAAGSAALLVVGYRMSSASEVGGPSNGAPIAATSDRAPSSAAPSTTTASLGVPTATQAPVEPKMPDKAADRAPDDALASAAQSGADALTDLSAKYPKDARVGKALALAIGKEPERTSELLRVLDNLFTLAPELAADPELSGFVRTAATKPATSQRAIDLMRTEMGAKGPEMLFDFVLNEPALRERARAALETSEAQRNLSPAVKIAYDLFTAPSCMQRGELVPQAIKDGDERAIFVLQMSSAKAHNCGPKRNKPCPAACDKEAPSFEQAIKEIQDRLAAKKANP